MRPRFCCRNSFTAAFNEDQPYDLAVTPPDDDFTPGAVQKLTNK